MFSIFNFFPEGVPKNESYQKYTCEALDFKGEAVAFKATSSGILEILKHCIEVCCEQKIKKASIKLLNVFSRL